MTIEATSVAGVVRQAAAALEKARRTHEPVEPLTESVPGLDLDSAYAIQVAQIEARVAGGRRIVGHKVGLTSKAMQVQLGVDSPDFGHLLDDMMHLEGQPVGVSDFISPKVEPEIAFVLSKDLRGPGVTVNEALAAVSFVLPALEIIDSRIIDWRIGLLDTVADNASSAGVVLGSRPVPIGDLDLRLVGCVLSCNGVPAGSGAGAAVLGSPINALVWLANVLGERGTGLSAGEVVIPGSITAAIPVRAGDVVTAEFGGLGSLSVRFD